jgi:hypothetical protein
VRQPAVVDDAGAHAPRIQGVAVALGLPVHLRVPEYVPMPMPSAYPPVALERTRTRRRSRMFAADTTRMPSGAARSLPLRALEPRLT